MNLQDIQCVCGWMSDIFSGINKFDLQSSSTTKIKNEVVGISSGVQYRYIPLDHQITGYVDDGHEYNWASAWQNQQNSLCAQRRFRSTWGIHSVWPVFAVCSMGCQGLNASSCGHRRLWSDWADAQTDLSLCWAHSHFVGFVVRRLNYDELVLNKTRMEPLCHTCEPLLLDMREIWFSFQGDWGLHQGDCSMAFLTRHFKLFSIKLERNFKKYMNYSTLCFKLLWN